MSPIAAVPLRFLPQANPGGYEENATRLGLDEDRKPASNCTLSHIASRSIQ
jgi:hypothetical protein